MPLVEEANAVIAARAQDLIAARARAGDLAHALKTPLAVLDVLVRRLRGNGQSDLADPIADEVSNMDRVIRRELARARANFHAASHQAPTLTFPIVERTCTAIARLSSTRSIALELEFDRTISLLVDETDLMEMVGNLTENAMKWARTTVVVSGRRLDGGGALLSIEDDGAGLSPAEIVAVQTRGVRLDESVQGTGLGLGIVRDLCELYGGELVLGRSDRAGFARRFSSLPIAWPDRSLRRNAYPFFSPTPAQQEARTAGGPGFRAVLGQELASVAHVGQGRMMDHDAELAPPSFTNSQVLSTTVTFPSLSVKRTLPIVVAVSPAMKTAAFSMSHFLPVLGREAVVMREGLVAADEIGDRTLARRPEALRRRGQCRFEEHCAHLVAVGLVDDLGGELLGGRQTLRRISVAD